MLEEVDTESGWGREPAGDSAGVAKVIPAHKAFNWLGRAAPTSVLRFTFRVVVAFVLGRMIFLSIV